MNVRVRFAPSPTGYLHVGGARTALYNYLFASSKEQGTFILRVEDTDLERSTRAFEQAQLKDLFWLGIDYDEGPDKPGKFGPYRQSERLDIYKKYALILLGSSAAYRCFCSAEELEREKEILKEKNLAPHYSGKCLQISLLEAENRVAAGEKSIIRFKTPQEATSFSDKLRGNVEFPAGMVGDFVIMRSNGMPVYNFCCMIDDWLMEISHVIRGDDHLNNTLRQIMLYKAFKVEPPQFIHVSLLVGKDKQKLSKRDGATSVTQYKEDGFLGSALMNYLVLLGWSHPTEKDVFDLEEMTKVFSLDRFSRSPAIFDQEKLKYINGQHLRKMAANDLAATISLSLPHDHPYHKQSEAWKTGVQELFKDKIEIVSEMKEQLDIIFSSEKIIDDELKEIDGWETTPQLREFFLGEIKKLEVNNEEFVSESIFNELIKGAKSSLKIKGKALFKGVRVVLTARSFGAELNRLIPLTPLKIILTRLRNE